MKKVVVRGESSRLLEERILKVSKSYSRLTLRQLFYILVSRYNYPLTRRFYNLLGYHTVKLRRNYQYLDLKFVDNTRQFICPSISFNGVELWVEKDAIRSFLEDLAERYRVPIQVERGFGSRSMFRDALIRARENGVGKILYIGDFDPSGLMIEKVTGREMGIKVERVALTREQILKYNPPSRSVNRRDSRADDYAHHFGSSCWEVEALDPDILSRIVEDRLMAEVPSQFIEEAKVEDSAARIVNKLIDDLAKSLRDDAYHLLKKGLVEEEIFTKLVSKYRLGGK